MNGDAATDQIQLQRVEWRRAKVLLITMCGLALGLAAYLWSADQLADWDRFKTDLTTYQGVTIGHTKTEVQYLVGAPQTVQGPEVKEKNGWLSSNPLRVWPDEENDFIPSGYEPVPQDKSARDYDEWHYWSSRGTVDVEFGKKTQRVTAVSCWIMEGKRNGCDPLFGIRSDTLESDVRGRLGAPDKEEVSGGGMLLGSPVVVVKLVSYDALGLKLTFQKQRVSRITKVAPHDLNLMWWMRNGRP